MSLLMLSKELIYAIIESSLHIDRFNNEINPQHYIKLSFTCKTLRCWIRSWIKSRSWETLHADIKSQSFNQYYIQSLLDRDGQFAANQFAKILDFNQDDTCQVRILHNSNWNETLFVRKRVHISELTVTHIHSDYAPRERWWERAKNYLEDYARYIAYQISCSGCPFRRFSLGNWIFFWLKVLTAYLIMIWTLLLGILIAMYCNVRVNIKLPYLEFRIN